MNVYVHTGLKGSGRDFRAEYNWRYGEAVAQKIWPDNYAELFDGEDPCFFILRKDIQLSLGIDGLPSSREDFRSRQLRNRLLLVWNTDDEVDTNNALKIVKFAIDTFSTLEKSELLATDFVSLVDQAVSEDNLRDGEDVLKAAVQNSFNKFWSDKLPRNEMFDGSSIVSQFHAGGIGPISDTVARAGFWHALNDWLAKEGDFFCVFTTLAGQKRLANANVTFGLTSSPDVTKIGTLYQRTLQTRQRDMSQPVRKGWNPLWCLVALLFGVAICIGMLFFYFGVSMHNSQTPYVSEK